MMGVVEVGLVKSVVYNKVCWWSELCDGCS